MGNQNNKASRSIAMTILIITMVISCLFGGNSNVQAAQGNSNSLSTIEYIKIGDRGDSVKTIQNILKKKGYYQSQIDGIFGNKTKKAVKEFQRDANIGVDGIVGPVTKKYLTASSKKNTNGGKKTKKVNAIITAYCSCKKCCNKNDGITASGTVAKQGRTIAAPKEYPFGTKIIIDGIEYTVEDRGGAIKNNKFDLYFESHQKALNWGKKTMEITVLYPA